MSNALSSHLIRLGMIWRNFKRNRAPLVISLLQRVRTSAEVSLRQLDQEGRKEFDDAKIC